MRVGFTRAAPGGRALLTLFLGMTPGCAVFAVATPHDLVAQAGATESAKCGHAVSEEERALQQPSVVERVEASYAVLRSARTGEAARLRGVKLQLRPLPGGTPEWVTRTLECHNVRRTLGKEDGPTDDPYYLPGVVLTFKVESLGDGLLVQVETDDVKDAAALLLRAQHFIARGVGRP